MTAIAEEIEIPRTVEFRDTTAVGAPPVSSDAQNSSGACKKDHTLTVPRASPDIGTGTAKRLGRAA